MIKIPKKMMIAKIKCGMEHSNNAQDNCSYTISIKGEGNIEEDEKKILVKMKRKV